MSQGWVFVLPNEDWKGASAVAATFDNWVANVWLAGATCFWAKALSCSLFAEGSRQGHFFLRFRLNCTRCISIAPAMLDRYLAA